MRNLAHRYLDYIYYDMVHKRGIAQLAQLEGEKAEVYLDLGCHNGFNTERVQQLLKPKRTFGLEFSSSVREAHCRGIGVARHDLNQSLPFSSNLADVITVFDVLEHLVETWKFLTEVYRVLKPGGCVLFDCPNLAAWHNVFYLFLGFQPSSGPHLVSILETDLKVVENMHRRDHRVDTPESHVEDYVDSKMHRHIVVPAYRSLRRVLIKAGFVVENSLGFGYYPFPPFLSDWLCQLDIGHAHHYIIKARKPL